MDRTELKYIHKLVTSGLCEEGSPLFGIQAHDITWSSASPECDVLEKVLRSLDLSSILFSAAAEPYGTIIEMLAGNPSSESTLLPDDTETRTFLHEIPIVRQFTPEAIINALRKRKGAIIKGHGIVTAGPVTPEQAFVTFSSICFSCYVKFMADYYYSIRGMMKPAPGADRMVSMAISKYRDALVCITRAPAITGPFTSGDMALKAIVETGALTVSSGMVDSYFGNISAIHQGSIYISQTGSSLDDLTACIDRCPVDNSTTCAITSSSEYSAHRAIYSLTQRKTVLHGHPRFSVIMSLLCDKEGCPDRGMCHVRCSAKRHIEDIPVVPGEIGTGPAGLSRTMPAAMTGRGVIVHGHGLFTAGNCDFTDAFMNLVDIEKMCFEKYVGLTLQK